MANGRLLQAITHPEKDRKKITIYYSKIKIMKNKIKLSIALAIGMFFITSCNNDKTTTKTENMDNTKMTDMENDTMDKKMDMEGMNMDNGLMGSMNTMMDKMSNMKMNGDFDLDYANMMIEHHQGALDMANIELSKGTDEKMKTMAQNIITKQTADIAKLKEFVQTYKPSGMKHGEGDMEKMQAEMKTAMKAMQMSGNTDRDFATMMISHHENGMKMSQAQVKNGMSETLKDMAKKGISQETKEIAEFKTWLSGNK